MAIPGEILKKVKMIELQTRKDVSQMLTGEYRTAFKGQGMEFAEFREYVPGDDIRAISWNLTARTGKPFIKKFEEERELCVIIAVDASASTLFGSGKKLKGEVAAHIAALLSLAALKNKDQVGLLLFTDEVELFVPPGKNRGHVHRIIRDILYHPVKGKKTRMSALSDFLAGILKKKALVFVISDFMEHGFEGSLKQLGRKHDLVAVWIRDPIEKKFPDLGLIQLEDLETEEVLTVDTSSSFFQKTFVLESHEVDSNREKKFRQEQIDFVNIDSQKSFVDPIAKFLRSRNRKR